MQKNWFSRVLSVIAVFCFTLFLLTQAGCGISHVTDGEKTKVDYTVVETEEIPQELKNSIEEKKSAYFKIVYEENEYLYIAQGYGEQETGGYSIQVEELCQIGNTLNFKTNLIGPGEKENTTKAPSFPFIVVKTKNLDQTVIFE